MPFKESDLYLVRFNNQPCDTIDYSQSFLPFCENSGWGDEEASVVCRSERNTRYGTGRKSIEIYIFVQILYYVPFSKSVRDHCKQYSVCMPHK